MYVYEEKASNLFHPAGFYSIYTAAASISSVPRLGIFHII